MKKLIGLFVFCMCFVFANAQNVGINTANPNATLDINGDIILRNSNMTLLSGANENINTTSPKFSHYTISGPATVFEIGGLTGGIDGRQITLYNSTAFLMVVKHLSSGSIALNQINTGSGVDITLSSYSSVAFRYHSVDNLWHILSTHNEWNPAATGLWSGFGSYIYNNNPGTVGIGTLSPSSSYKLFVRGNTYTEGNSLAYSSTISGGALEVSSSDLPNQFIRMDGKNIQSLGAASAILPITPKDLVLNPFGSNIQIGTQGSAQLSTITFPNRLGNKISFWNAGANNDFGIGLNSGNLQLYTAGNDKISFGNGNANAFNESVSIITGGAQKGIYASQTGNLNIVPLGIVQYYFQTAGTGVTNVVIDNLGGNLATGVFTNTTTLSDDDRIIFRVFLDYAQISPYIYVFGIGGADFDGINRFVITARSAVITAGSSAYLEATYVADGFIPTGNTAGSFTGRGKFVIYGVK